MGNRCFTLPLFLNFLPFGADHGAIRDLQRYRSTLSATHAVNLMPVLGDWNGTGTPVFNLVSRGGQLMNLSLFDSALNDNACIAAQSGSGKSFLTNDLYANPTGRAIAENSAHTFLLAQPAQAIDQLQAAKRLPLTESGAEILKTVHTVPGAYSEIMVIGDYGAGIGRLIVDPFRQLLYSTQPRDVAALTAWRRQGLTIDAAIGRLLQDRGHG
ncbi:hypothetical protein [uncultured Thiocystis sp.]|uniref:hypothetical protein n=1 Tax=uncultured Thiocystis sp. TaxID=1202134 RepID=UPI0025EA4714|nr:hypothetical protein [uncultured Thiocystis sp.]